MKGKTAIAAALAVGALALTACSTGDDDRCRTNTVMFYSTVDHHYHYGSPKGKTVPAYKVPSSARKVPGYKPVGPAKPPKVSLKKPSAPKPGPAPRVRTGRR